MNWRILNSTDEQTLRQAEANREAALEQPGGQYRTGAALPDANAVYARRASQADYVRSAADVGMAKAASPAVTKVRTPDAVYAARRADVKALV